MCVIDSTVSVDIKSNKSDSGKPNDDRMEQDTKNHLHFDVEGLELGYEPRDRTESESQSESSSLIKV